MKAAVFWLVAARESPEQEATSRYQPDGRLLR